MAYKKGDHLKKVKKAWAKLVTFKGGMYHCGGESFASYHGAKRCANRKIADRKAKR